MTTWEALAVIFASLAAVLSVIDVLWQRHRTRVAKASDTARDSAIHEAVREAVEELNKSISERIAAHESKAQDMDRRLVKLETAKSAQDELRDKVDRIDEKLDKVAEQLAEMRGEVRGITGMTKQAKP